MNELKPTWEEMVSAAAEMEWPDRTPAAVIACSFHVDRKKRLIHLLFHVDAALSDSEFDDVSEFEGGIISHLPEDWQTRMEVKLLPRGEAPQLVGNVPIYRRGDEQTPDRRWWNKKSLPLA